MKSKNKTKTTKTKTDGEGDNGPFMSLDEDSDSSRVSLVTVGSQSSAGSRKRSRIRDNGDDGSQVSSDSELDAPATKLTSDSQRGRGRPPTTGQYVGLAKAKAALVAAERDEMELRAEQEVALLAEKILSERQTRSRRLSDSADSEEELASALNKKALDCVAAINAVATKSKNLKGGYVRALKAAASTIKVVVGDLHQRSSNEETKRLQAANERLQSEVTDLRNQIAELRREITQAPSASKVQTSQRQTIPAETLAMEEMQQSLLRQFGGILNARLEGLEDRLLPQKRLRPPLAADRRNAAAAAAAIAGSSKEIPKPACSLSEPGVSGTSNTPDTTRSMPGPSKGKGKGQGKKTKTKKDSDEVVENSVTATSNQQSPPTQSSESWVKVVKRRRKKNRPAKQQQPQSGPARSKAAPKPKLRVPRTSAVVLTIQPEAAKRGMSYAEALTDAKKKVNLAVLGIQSLHFRKAATGGRVLEIPGVTSPEKADTLAAKLKEIFNEQDIKVSRPMKCADLRVSGLDDSVTKEEVAIAISKVGECQADQVKVNDIRRNSNGIGTTFIRCPVAAAKKVTNNNRILVGWVSAQVKLLTPRPMRCFRCLEVGHVRGQCTADTDRSNQCYRCGQLGHKAKECSSEKPYCTICAAAGKPTEHRIGNKEPCALPPKKRSRKNAAGSQLQPSLPSQDEESQMDEQ